MNRRASSALLILRTSLVTAVVSAAEIACTSRYLGFNLRDRTAN